MPRNYSERLYSLRDTIDEGTEVPLLPMRQLLKKCATSAKHGYEWATVDRGLEVLHLIVASGLRPDLDCYRYLFQIAAEDCWQGLLSHERVRQLYEAMKKEEGVTPDIDVINSVLECTAGLAQYNLTTLADGQALFNDCVEFGIEPDLVSWAGLLDILMGEIEYGTASARKVEGVLAGLKKANLTQKRTYDKWYQDIEHAYLLKDPHSNMGGGTNWRSFRKYMKGKGYSLQDLGFLWRQRKIRLREVGVI